MTKKATKPAESPIFSVLNHHIEDCGEPPHIIDKPAGLGCYLGYFENEHGEQAIYRYDFKTKKATLQLGDAGWKTEFYVVDGVLKNCVLNEPEKIWLLACWQASGEKR